MNMHIPLSSVHFVLYRALFEHPTLERTFYMNMVVFVCHMVQNFTVFADRVATAKIKITMGGEIMTLSRTLV